MPEWFEDEEFWRTSASSMFGDPLWQVAPGDVDGVIELAGIAPPARVLDLGCGPGRHALELARRGFRVTGVDLSEYLLGEARRRAQESGLAIDLIQQDMREFRGSQEFECALNLFTSFGFFQDPADDRRVVENVFRALVSGGAFVLDTMGKEILARIFQRRDWREHEGELWLYERTVRDDWSWMENRWIVVRDGARKEFAIGHRLFSAAELSSLMLSCGFRRVDAYGDFEGAAYDHNARRLVIVARK